MEIPRTSLASWTLVGRVGDQGSDRCASVRAALWRFAYAVTPSRRYYPLGVIPHLALQRDVLVMESLMSSSGSRPNFAAAQSSQDGTISVAGLHAAVTIRRDDLGVAHISAANEHDAWLGQGYASAQDRLWQM